MCFKKKGSLAGVRITEDGHLRVFLQCWQPSAGLLGAESAIGRESVVRPSVNYLPQRRLQLNPSPGEGLLKSEPTVVGPALRSSASTRKKRKTFR